MSKKKFVKQFIISTISYMIAYALYYGGKYAVTQAIRRLRKSNIGGSAE